MKSDIANTPPLGWNSWDCYGAAVTEKQLKENADYMAENLKKFGWEYIVCDIQWYEPSAVNNDYNNFADLEMDGYGRLIPATNRFPSAANGRGFRPIADYCHERGLKFGIHILRGIPRQAVHKNTPVKDTELTARQITHQFSVCPWNTDMYGLSDCDGAQAYYNSLFELYASWNVDFIKCDDICVTEFSKYNNPYGAPHEIEMIRKAIDGCGRDMVLSLSPGPADIKNAAHLIANANMWRLTGDFWDEYCKLYEMFDICERWQGVGKPGSWPDCDMLPIGKLSKNGRCCGNQNRMSNFTYPELLTLMSLFGIFKSPLMIGGNLPETDDITLSILTNAEYMNMHKTSYGARLLSRKEVDKKGEIIWTSNGDKCKYAAVFNTRDEEADIMLDLSQILMPHTEYSAYDIWNKQNLGLFTDQIKLNVQPHGARLLKIK